MRKMMKVKNLNTGEIKLTTQRKLQNWVDKNDLIVDEVEFNSDRFHIHSSNGKHRFESWHLEKKK